MEEAAAGRGLGNGTWDTSIYIYIYLFVYLFMYLFVFIYIYIYVYIFIDLHNLYLEMNGNSGEKSWMLAVLFLLYVRFCRQGWGLLGWVCSEARWPVCCSICWDGGTSTALGTVPSDSSTPADLSGLEGNWKFGDVHLAAQSFKKLGWRFQQLCGKDVFLHFFDSI